TVGKEKRWKPCSRNSRIRSGEKNTSARTYSQPNSRPVDVTLSTRTGHYTPSKILCWDLDNRIGRKLVYGGDGYLIAKLAKCSRQHLSTFFLFSGTDFVALLDKSHSFMQDLPNETTEPMSHRPDGGLIAQAGQQTPEHGLKMTAFLRHRSVCCLVQHSA